MVVKQKKYGSQTKKSRLGFVLQAWKGEGLRNPWMP